MTVHRGVIVAGVSAAAFVLGWMGGWRQGHLVGTVEATAAAAASFVRGYL